ncbi:hypothetical protein [Microbacterium arborescens]|uniref:hypothetical protein n=1 Tax=Microbacterium arborescens TaxID=33883 RepID=UPI003C7595D9
MTRSDTGDVTAPLRRVQPPEAPYPGELLGAVGGAAYRVDAHLVPRRVWAAEPGGHFLAAVDVDRAAGATVVVLPRLAGRLCGGEAEFDLAPGQAVTLAVSVLRGAAAAADAEWDEGEWWSTDDGRPVLVPTGDRSWRESSAVVMNRLPRAALPGPLRERALEALNDPVTLPFTVPRLEDDLFAVATPQPIDVAPHPVPSQRPPRDIDHGESEDGTRTVRAVAAGLIDGEIIARATSAMIGARDACRRAAFGVARRFRRGGGATGARSRARGLAAAAAAAVVATLCIGFLWPETTTPEAAGVAGAGAPPAEQASSAAPDAARDETPTPASSGAGPATPAEPAAAEPSNVAAGAEPMARAVDELARCGRAAGSGCRADVLERPDAELPEGIATSGDARDVTVLDDLGGVEVVRVDDPSGRLPAQVVVLVSHGDKRLVRDVYDVADQP